MACLLATVIIDKISFIMDPSDGKTTGVNVQCWVASGDTLDVIQTWNVWNHASMFDKALPRLEPCLHLLTIGECLDR